MKRGALILIVLLIPCVAANTGWIFNAQEVQLANEIHQSIGIIKSSELSRVGFLGVNTTLFPKPSSRQRISIQFTEPNTSRKGGRYIFDWRLPSARVNYSVYTSISNQFLVKEISKRVAFPLEEIPKEVEEYVKETPRVDFSNPEIKALASQLAEGEDDLYELLFKIGVWAHDNIQYSSEPDVRDAGKSASWVLANRRGACDEFSALFMAIARALNIPVRYVTGQAYSNIGEKPWQLHGWVEAYLPLSGWIPFDPTFGELGFIDNSHIEFMYSAEVGKSPATLIYDAVSTNFSISEPVFITNVTGVTGTPPRLYTMRVEPFKPTVGLKSHNMITITLNNTRGFYQVVYLTLGRTSGLNYLDNGWRFVLLKPREAKKEYFIVKTEDNLSDRFAYTFPIRAITSSNYSAGFSFESRRDFEVLSYERVKALVDQLRGEQQVTTNKTLVQELSIACSFVGNQSYVREMLPFNCTVKNRGNTALKAIKICDKAACAPFTLGIQETKRFPFKERFEEPGVYDIIFRVEGPMLSKSSIQSIRVLPLPSLAIASLEHPGSVRYKDNFKIVFLLNSTTQSPVEDVRVNLSHEFIHDSFALQDFQRKKLITLDSRGRDLKVGPNNFTLIVGYKDLQGRRYETRESFLIRLERLSFFQKIPIWFRGLFTWLDNLFK